MPFYDYRCPTCETTFDLRRSMDEANEPATCPGGHAGGVRQLSRLLPLVKAGAAGGGQSMSAPMGGGGCGGHCACH